MLSRSEKENSTESAWMDAGKGNEGKKGRLALSPIHNQDTSRTPSDKPVTLSSSATPRPVAPVPTPKLHSVKNETEDTKQVENAFPPVVTVFSDDESDGMNSDGTSPFVDVNLANSGIASANLEKMVLTAGTGSGKGGQTYSSEGNANSASSASSSSAASNSTGLGRTDKGAQRENGADRDKGRDEEEDDREGGQGDQAGECVCQDPCVCVYICVCMHEQVYICECVCINACILLVSDVA